MEWVIAIELAIVIWLLVELVYGIRHLRNGLIRAGKSKEAE